MPATSPLDAAAGALFGAFIAESAGAVLEFLGRPPTEHEVDHAMALSGGGVLGVAPGQITDDGELTLCLAQALLECAEPGDHPDRAAAWYVRWLRSNPFDLGNTTWAALSLGGALGPERVPSGAELAAFTGGHGTNQASQANGSLMRCTPLGIWGHRMDDEALVALARADSALTHPHPACCDAVAAYSLAVAELVARRGPMHGTAPRSTQNGGSGPTPTRWSSTGSRNPWSLCPPAFPMSATCASPLPTPCTTCARARPTSRPCARPCASAATPTPTPSSWVHSWAHGWGVPACRKSCVPQSSRWTRAKAASARCGSLPVTCTRSPRGFSTQLPEGGYSARPSAIQRSTMAPTAMSNPAHIMGYQNGVPGCSSPRSCRSTATS